MSDTDSFLKNWNTQTRKGLLEMLILRSLQASDSYGYELSSEIGRCLEITITDGAMYSALRRLHKIGAVKPYLRDSGMGPARKYYKLTETGRRLYADLDSNWRQTVRNVGALPETGNGEGELP